MVYKPPITDIVILISVCKSNFSTIESRNMTAVVFVFETLSAISRCDFIGECKRRNTAGLRVKRTNNSRKKTCFINEISHVFVV